MFAVVAADNLFPAPCNFGFAIAIIFSMGLALTLAAGAWALRQMDQIKLR